MAAGISAIFSRITLLKQIPIFRELKWLHLQKIARASTLVEFKKGEIIRRQGDPADAFYCLISGRVQSFQTSPDGKKHEVEFIRRGMHFGIISLLTGESHTANYETVNDSVILKIEKPHFEKLLKSIPQLGVDLSQSLSKRIRSHRTHTRASFESTIIAVYSPIPQTGTSTYAVNLAHHLQNETGKKVILVNLSADVPAVSASAAGAPRWLKAPADLKIIADDDDKIWASVSRGELPFASLNVNIRSRDVALVSLISPFLSVLVGEYDFVILDLPHERDDVVTKALLQSDIVHLITSDQKDHLKQARQVIYQLEESLRENFHPENVHVIVNIPSAGQELSYEEINHEIDYRVLLKLPPIEPAQLSVPLVCSALSAQLPGKDSEYSRAVRKIARQTGGVLVGLVLGGGAALGVAHVGVVRVLEEEGIPIDVVVGSSMGALLGSFWTIGKDSHELEALAREFETPKGMLKLYEPVFPISSLVGVRSIVRWLRKTLGDRTFYDTIIPFKVVAYDLVKRQELVIDSGPLIDAVRKSIAIPGVLTPYTEKDRLVIDGGVLNPLPTNVLAQMGIRKIIAVNVLQSPEHVSKGYEMEQLQEKEKAQISFARSPLGFIGARIGGFFQQLFSPNVADIIVRTLQASEYVISQESAKSAQIVIHPNLEGIKWFELYKVDALIKSGEEATRKALPAIKSLVQQ